MSRRTAPVNGQRTPVGVALRIVNRVAGAAALDRRGLRKPTERMLFQATKTGFRAAAAASRTFSAASRLGQPARPRAVS
nr:hypothetical protein [Micromonospora sp. DSM 115978]